MNTMLAQRPAIVAAMLVLNLKSLRYPMVPMYSLLINSSFYMYSLLS